VTLTETTRIARADPPEPHLRIGAPGEQAIRGGDLVSVHLVSTGLYVDDDELALVVRSEARDDFSFVDLVSTPGELFFAVARSDHDGNLLRSLLIESVRRNPSTRSRQR
jgi:hypothetical protein